MVSLKPRVFFGLLNRIRTASYEKLLDIGWYPIFCTYFSQGPGSLAHSREGSQIAVPITRIYTYWPIPQWTPMKGPRGAAWISPFPFSQIPGSPLQGSRIFFALLFPRHWLTPEEDLKLRRAGQLSGFAIFPTLLVFIIFQVSEPVFFSLVFFSLLAWVLSTVHYPFSNFKNS